MITPSIMSFVNDPVKMAAWKEWADNAVTKRMLELVKDAFGATGLSPDKHTAEHALYYAGQVDTAAQILRLLGELDAVREIAEVGKAFNMLKAEYGARAILERAEQRGESI